MIQPTTHHTQEPDQIPGKAGDERGQIGFQRLEHDPDGKYIVLDLAEPVRDEITVEDLYGMLSAAHTYLEEHKGLRVRKPLSHFIRPEQTDRGGFVIRPECVEVSYRDAGDVL